MFTYLFAIFAISSLYREFNFFWIKRRIKGSVKIISGAESFFYKRGKKGILLLHGFTSSPKEFRELGHFLSKKKITVYAPLLPGHGTNPERLAVIKWYQWIEAVNEAVRFLENECDEMYIAGNSFGGNLALIAAQSSKKIKGVITLGTPISFHNQKFWKAVYFIIKRVKLFQKKNYKKTAMKKEIVKKRVAYDTIPLPAINHFVKVINISKSCIPEIHKPTLIIQVKDDEVIDDESANYIYDNIKSKRKKIFWLHDSYHVILLDSKKGKAFHAIEQFISE